LSADAVDLPFAAATFDVGLAHFMLYHTTDKSRALSELRRVVRGAGWVGIVLTRQFHMKQMDEKLMHTVPGLSLAPGDSAVFHADTAAPLIRSTFTSVQRHDYEYTMAVDNPDSVVSYIRSKSSIQAAGLSPDQWTLFRDGVAGEIREKGAFLVNKRCSLFICCP
jgi:ubiquinone/menaquinone biosynthesis C-methylase UbiE